MISFDNTNDYIGKCVMSVSHAPRGEYCLWKIVDIIDGQSTEHWILLTDDFCDVGDEPIIQEFTEDNYKDCILIEENVWNHIISTLNSASSTIKKLIESSIIPKRTLHKGDCVVDKQIMSLYQADADTFRTGCLAISYDKTTLSYEDAPMDSERWKECENVKPEVFNQAENIFQNTIQHLMDYLNTIYNSQQTQQ